MNYFSDISDLVIVWAKTHLLPMILIIVVAFVAKKISGSLIEKLVRKVIVRGNLSSEAEIKRENTIIRIATSVVGILIWIVAAVMVLSEAGIDIGPILAGLGVAGVAFGFGAQYLIRDLISGLFMLIENQYRVGDVVCFGDTCGAVEDISMRMTTLRDAEGTVHHISNGSIGVVSNKSKFFSKANVDIGIAYEADIDEAINVVNRVGKEISESSEWGNKINEAPKFLRITDLADSAVVIRVTAETKPGEQWAVAGEIRKRLKLAFDKAGIEIPFPQRVIHKK